MNELKIYRIRPLIFRVFNLMTRPPYPDFKKFPQLLESIGHLAKQLLVGYNPIQGYLETLLSFCPNIMDLAIWVFRIKSMFPILDKLPLRRLCANFDDFAYEDFLARPFFVNLTHLEIFTFMGETWDRNYEALVHLPTLTHLLIRCSIEVKLIPQLLRQCRPLRILIISPVSTHRYLQRDSAEERLAEINDYRLVFLESPSFASLVDDWDKGAHGGIDCWAFGELVSLAQSRASFSSFMIRDNLNLSRELLCRPITSVFPKDWICLEETSERERFGVVWGVTPPRPMAQMNIINSEIKGIMRGKIRLPSEL